MNPETKIGINSLSYKIGPPVTSDIQQSIRYITEMTKNQNFWQENDYNRVSLLRTENIEVVAIFWRQGQSSAVHDHKSSSCYFAVVQGELKESKYLSAGDSNKYSELLLTPDHGIQNEQGHHSIECKSEKAISLHYYSPPISTKD